MPEEKNTDILADVSKEDLLKVLKEKGFDFKELAAEAKIAKNLGTVTAGTKKKPNQTGFSLELNDHADFIIKKTTGPKAWKMLVVMPSQGTSFFKDQSGNITPLTDDMLKGFMRGMPTIEINSWVDNLTGGADEANALLRILKDPVLMEMEKLNIGPRFNHHKQVGFGNVWWENGKKYYDLYKNYKDCYEKIPQLLKTFAGQYDILDMICSSRFFFIDLVETFGVQNARDFVEESKHSLAILEELDKCGSVYKREYNNSTSRPNIEMDYKTFKEFMLYDSVFMGMAKNIKDFMQTWNDTLSMQEKIYKKIKYKYPKDLLLLHQQLSYKCDLMKEKIDAENFAKQSEIAQKYEATVGDYIFIAPKVKEDFFDEATQQANCLASYVSRFTDGQDIIMFMRYKETPEDSLVTIELINNKVVQKYQARNQQCTPEQNDVIEKWLKKVTKKDGE